MLALTLHFARFGYTYASGDQDETLSLVLRRLDPSLFSGDWFLGLQEGSFGVRDAFVTLLSGIAQIMPLWAAVLLLHVATFLLTSYAVYRLAERIAGSTTIAIATTLITVVALPQWTLGANDLVHSILAPSTVAWTLSLWAVWFSLSGRVLTSGALLGFATLFQALVGLQSASVVFAYLLFRSGRRFGGRVRDVAVALLPFLILAVPLVASLILRQAAAPRLDDAYPSVFYILAEFRAPHHYLPSGFPTSSIVRFTVLAVAGIAGLALTKARVHLRETDFLFVGLYVLISYLVLGYLFTEILPIPSVAFVQPFKVTVLAKPFLVLGVVGAVGILFRLRSTADAHVHRRPLLWSSGMLLIAGFAVLLIGVSERTVTKRVHPVAHARDGLGMAERWARESTDERATFLVPPSNTTFRIRAQRGIVVNFKSIPFEPDYLRSWFQRLLAIAPIALPDRGGAALLPELDEAYTTQSPTRLTRLASQFGAEYILIEREVNAPELLREVYSSGTWYLYEPVETSGPHLTFQLPRRVDGTP